MSEFMSPDEMRKLDKWLAVHAMGWIDDVEGSGYYFNQSRVQRIDYHEWQPTVDRGDAFLVLKECAERSFPTVYQSRATSDWCVDNQSTESGKATIIESATTLELAICLFAKRLFNK